MNKMKFTNWIFFLISMVLSFCFFCSLVLTEEAKQENTITIKTTNNKNSDSNSKKVVINEIWIDKSNIPLKKFRLNNDFKYNEENDYIISDNKNISYFSFTVSNISDVSVVFQKDNSSGKVEIDKNGNSTTYELYDDTSYNYVVNVFDNRMLSSIINYIQNNNINILIFISLISIPVYFYILNYFIIILNKLKNNKFKIKDIIISILFLTIIFISSGYFILELFDFFILIPLFLISILGLNHIKHTIKKDISIAFIFLSIILGVSFAILLPPFNVPDEGSHFYKAFRDSFVFEEKIYQDGESHYMKGPKSIENLFFTYGHSLLDYSYTISPKTIFKHFSDSFNYKNLNDKSFSYSNTKNLSFLCYIPTILVIQFSKIVNLAPIFIILISKILNLTIWIILCYYTLKKIPKFKTILFIIMLLPIMIQEASGINQDYLTNGLFFLLTALIFKEIYNSEKLSLKSQLNIILVSILLGFCKMGYFPIIFASLLIPTKNFNNKKDMILKKSLIIIPILIVFIYTYLTSFSGTVDSTKFYTIPFLLKKPFEFVTLLFNTVYNSFDYHLFRGLFNGFGWSTKYHSPLGTTITQIIFAILLLTPYNKDENLSSKERILILLISFMQIGIIIFAFITHTTKGSLNINGLQPRYFFPAITIFCIAISNKKILIKTNNNNFTYSILLLISFFISFFTIIQGFYI